MTEFIRAPKSNRFTLPQPSVTPSHTTVHMPHEYPLDPRLQACIDTYAHNPLGFVLDTFFWSKPGTRLADRPGPRQWQVEVLEAIGMSLEEDDSIVRVAIASGKGAGKTSLASWLFLWHVACHRRSQTIATSVTGFQSQSRFWREVRVWRALWTLRDCFKVQSTRLEHVEDETWLGQHQTWNIDRPEAFQGTHEEHVGFIVDEASGVPDEILSTIETGMTDAHTFILYIANPTRSTGLFRECFRGLRSERWLTRNIDTRTVDEVNQVRIREQLEDVRGDEHAAAFLRNVCGQFADEEYDAVIPAWILHDACERQAEQDPWTPITIGVDIARFGTAKTVFLVRQGRAILEVQVYNKQELETTADRLIDLIAKYSRYHLTVYCDGDGLSIAVPRLCAKAGYHVQEVHSAIQAFHHQQYANKRAELWFTARKWLRDEACLDATAPYFQSLQEQLLNIYYRHDSSDRMLIESKEEMAARNIPSPDMADALAYSLFAVARPGVWTIPMKV